MKIAIAKGEKKGGIQARLVDGTDTRFVEHDDGSQELRVGIGKREDMTWRKLINVARHVVSLGKQYKARALNVSFDDFVFPQIAHTQLQETLAEMLAREWELARYEFRRYKTKPKEGWHDIDEIRIEGVAGDVVRRIEAAIVRGHTVGKEINMARDLANTPGGEMTPKLLALAAKEAVKGTTAKVSVLGRTEMKKLGMGAVLGVAQGSTEEPQFIVVDYKGAGTKERPIVFVGKGVTFDTGGINLKPDHGIGDMHMDMAGGGAAIYAAVLAARLKLKKNVIAIVPAVENMPSGSSYRPGDVLRSLSGKTIEVLNTDAEGRIILADGLTYAKRYNPRLVVDIATLTGASLVALGEFASAIMTTNPETEQLLREFGETSGDYVWPFPLWEEYEDMVKGNIGDVANIPAVGNPRFAGVIGGGMFLYQFAKEYPKDCAWVHIDMASRMLAVKGEHLAKGATGAPIRLLLSLIEKY